MSDTDDYTKEAVEKTEAIEFFVNPYSDLDNYVLEIRLFKSTKPSKYPEHYKQVDLPKYVLTDLIHDLIRDGYIPLEVEDLVDVTTDTEVKFK